MSRPAFVVVALGVNATNALVISQVVLSIALPLPMIALLIFTRRADSRVVELAICLQQQYAINRLRCCL